MYSFDFVVPSLQLIVAKTSISPAAPQPLFKYTCNIMLSMKPQYNLISTTVTNATNTGGETETTITLSYYLKPGFVSENNTQSVEVMTNSIDLESFSTSKVANRSVKVVVQVYRGAFDPRNPPELLWNKSGKMRLEDAEVGVDPDVHGHY